MKALLVGLLSICLLVSSVSPALAQARPTQVVRGVRQGMSAAVQGAGKAAQGLGKLGQATGAVPDLTQRVTQQATQQVMQARLEQFFALTQQSQLTPDTLAFMNNEAISLLLQQRLAPQHVKQAVSLYRTQLAKRGHLLADVHLPNHNLTEFARLNIRVIQDRFLEIFSSASSLGLAGTAADAEVLIQFYQQAAQGPLKELAQVVTARGLLRLEAYDAFNRWVKTVPTQGTFWQELAQYVRQEGLPVDFQPQAGDSELPNEGIARWLAQSHPTHALHADPSAAATAQWISLGRPGTAAAAEEVALAPVPAAPAAKLEIPALPASFSLSALETNLTLSPQTLTAGTATAAGASPVQHAPAGQPAAAHAQASASSSGILYSGVPFFALADVASKVTNGLKKLYRKLPTANKRAAKSEDPQLHESAQIHTVSDELLRYERGVASADETAGIEDHLVVDFAEDGFLLTLETEGNEQILPVNLRISNRFLNRNWRSFMAHHSRTPYNRVVIKPEPRLKKGDYVLEMRNQTKKPGKMDHFYFRLQKNQVGLLAQWLEKQGVAEFKIKLELNPVRRYESMDVPVLREGTLEKTPLVASVPLKMYTPNSQLVLMSSGELGWLLPGQAKPVAEDKMYVRLPKHQLTDLVEVLKNVPPDTAQKLNIAIRSTQNGARFISTAVSLGNLSLGKTFGPMVKGPLDISAAGAENLMFGINYVLPGLSSLLTPALKKYGERRMMTISVALSTLAGALATAGGFYGMVEGVSLNPLQKGMFISALVLMSASSILKQLTTNLLIRANGGEVEYKKKEGQEAEKQVSARTETSFQLLKRRMQEVFRPKVTDSVKQAENKSQLAHLISYNLGFIFKNVGTLAFLALPYAINQVASWFGLDLGLDFSVSFPIYTVYSAVLTWRMMQAKLRDAYSAKNVEQSRGAIEKSVNQLKDELAKPNPHPEDVDVRTRALYDELDSYVSAKMKVNPGLKRSDVYPQAKAEALDLLEKSLEKTNIPAPQAEELVHKTDVSLGKLEGLLKNMAQMLKVPGVTPLLIGMTAATVHEFVVSSSFASVMNSVIDAGDLANFWVAITLYFPMIVGRIGGNLLSSKISPGSMYMFCSALSGLGTLVLGAAGGNVPLMVAGASVASLGMGNYYTQMYNYIMETHKKYRRELSSLLSLTMALGGLGAMLTPTKLGLTGSAPWDMVFAGGVLAASWLFTQPMFASSSFVRVLKNMPAGQKLSKAVRAVKASFHKPKPPQTPNLDDAAAAH